MNLEWVKYLVVGLLILFLDQTVLSHLSLWGVSFDPLLIYLIWILPKQGRIATIYTVAFLAIIQDALLDTWGMYLLSKSVLVLFFHNYLIQKFETKIFIGQFFGYSLIIALIHNLTFYLFASLTGDYATGWWPFTLILLSGMYTATISLVTYLIYYK